MISANDIDISSIPIADTIEGSEMVIMVKNTTIMQKEVSKFFDEKGIVTSTNITKILKLTQSEYDAISPKDNTILYYIVG